MKTMKVAMVTEPYKVEIVDCPIPEAGPGDVLVKVRAAGVCGSDLHLFKGTHAFRKPPAPLGHEVAGEVEWVGADVTDLKVGQRVTVFPQVECGECEFCQIDRQNLCINKRVPGTPKWGGTFAEYFVAPRSVVFPLNDEVSYESGVLVEPLAVAVHALRQVTVDKRESVAILGTGTIGLLCAIVAKEMGYKRIYCTDTVPFNREMALKKGAVLALNPLEGDVVEEIRSHNGGGVDVTLIAAGAPDIINQASKLTKRLGDVVLISMITKDIPVYSYSFVFNEQKLIGAMTYQTRDFIEAMNMVNGGLNLDDCATQRLPLDQSQEALTMLDQKKGDIVKIMVYPGR